MKVIKKDPPRSFRVGNNKEIELLDCGEIYLSKDEMVTFKTKDEKQFDFTAKSWGYYVTPSINVRLVDQGYKTALVKKQEDGKYFVVVVDRVKKDEFLVYSRLENIEVLEWLDER